MNCEALALARPATETVTWTKVADAMPDSDTTVLVQLVDDNEPTWLGFHDGLGWCDVSTGGYFSGRVVAWAEMLKGVA